jgi:hypothetical protein
MMKAAEKNSGPRVRGAHQDILGRPVLGDLSCDHEQDTVSDIAGEGSRGETTLNPPPTQGRSRGGGAPINPQPKDMSYQSDDN